MYKEFPTFSPMGPLLITEEEYFSQLRHLKHLDIKQCDEELDYVRTQLIKMRVRVTYIITPNPIKAKKDTIKAIKSFVSQRNELYHNLATLMKFRRLTINRQDSS